SPSLAVRDALSLVSSRSSSPFLFFKYVAPPDISPLSLHDALPIFQGAPGQDDRQVGPVIRRRKRISQNLGSFRGMGGGRSRGSRSEEHTSELQSLTNLVCRLLLEKKKAADRSIPVCSCTPPKPDSH